MSRNSQLRLQPLAALQRMMAPSLISRAALASWLLMLKFLIASSSPTGSVTSMSTDVVDTIADETTSREITFEWSSNVSLLYPPSSPLTVQLGTLLKINCPKNGTSNIWIQKYLQQYEQCDCNTIGDHEGGTDYSKVSDPCIPRTTTRQICQDEVLIEIASVSQDLDSALGFNPGETYYFISYSPGDRPLAGYSDNTSGGECLLGYKMVLYIQSNNPPTTTEPLTTQTTTQETTTGLPLATTMTTGSRVGPTEQLQGTQFTENDTASGTVTLLFNLNYLTIAALLSLWYVSQ